MKHIKFIIAIILMLIVVVLIVENHEAMSTKVKFNINFLSIGAEPPEMSLYHVVTIAFLFGVLITGLYGMVERFRFKKQIRVLTKESLDKDKELDSLRNLPITSDEVSSDQSTSL